MPREPRDATIIVGQNGAQRTQNTRIARAAVLSLCRWPKTKSEGSILVVTLQASAAGASGSAARA